MSTNESVLCAQCGGPLSPNAASEVATCSYCGTTSVPRAKVIERIIVRVRPPVESTPQPAKCPRCFDTLVRKRVQETTIHGCERCGGVFLDHAAVEKLGRSPHPDFENEVAAALGASTLRPDLRPNIACPECAKPMTRTAITGTQTTIDTCAEHGTWFDSRELPLVVAPSNDETPPRARGWFSGLFG